MAAAEWRLVLAILEESSLESLRATHEMRIRARGRSYAALGLSDGYVLVFALPRHSFSISYRALDEAARELETETGLSPRFRPDPRNGSASRSAPAAKTRAVPRPCGTKEDGASSPSSASSIPRILRVERSDTSLASRMVTTYSSSANRSVAGSPGAHTNRLWVLALALGVGGCTPPRAASAVAPPPEPTKATKPLAPTSECVLPARPPPNGRFAADFLALESLSNVGRLAIGVEEPRHGARRVPSPRAKAAFPKVQFQTIEAHAYRYWDPLPPEIAAAFPGCDEHVLSDDGRICPSATLPAKPLSAAQSAEFLALAALPESRTRFRCDFDPHHAFVFRDARGRPVADVQVCFECGEWTLNDARPRTLPEGAFTRLAALCRELELGGCPTAQREDESDYWESYRAWFELGAPPRPSVALAIPAQTRLSALTAEQQRKLCAYRAAESPLLRFDSDEPAQRPRYELEKWQVILASNL